MTFGDSAWPQVNLACYCQLQLPQPKNRIPKLGHSISSRISQSVHFELDTRDCTSTCTYELCRNCDQYGDDWPHPTTSNGNCDGDYGALVASVEKKTFHRCRQSSHLPSSSGGRGVMVITEEPVLSQHVEQESVAGLTKLRRRAQGMNVAHALTTRRSVEVDVYQHNEPITKLILLD